MSKFKIYVYTGADDLLRAIVRGFNNVNAAAALPGLVIGSARDFDLYLIDGNGSYDSRSGDATYTPRLGAGPIGGTATGGTFPLNDSSGSTAALDYDATAAQVQTALNALNAGTGPNGGTVTVTRQAVGAYTVDWDAVGARDKLTGTSKLLTPESVVVVDRTRTGDGTTKEQQVIRLVRQPVVYADGLTTIANGWTGTLSANNARALALLAGDAQETTDFEIEIEGPIGPPDLLARAKLTISNEIINPATFAGDELPLALLSTDPKIPRFFASITGLTGGTSTDLDSLGSDLPVGTLAIIGATVSASIPGVMWQLKTSGSRPAEGPQIVHVDADASKYWQFRPVEDGESLTVLNATERLALGTPAGTYVEQTDTPNVIFFQTGADASLAASWLALPASKEADGSISIDLVPSIGTISGSSHDMTGRLRRIWAKLNALSRDRIGSGSYSIFVIGGSGSPESHGVYARNGTENNKERFSYGDDFKAYWNGSEWQVINSALNEVLFTNPSTASTLPTSGWVVGVDGTGPAAQVEPYHTQTLRFASIGDSVGQRPANLIARTLTEMFTEQSYDQPHPSVGVSINKYGLQPGHINAILGGSAIQHTKSGGTPDYSIFYTGTYWELAAATSDTITLKSSFDDTGLIDADTIKIYYVRDAGLGTFDVELSTTSDSSGFTTEESAIDTSNGTKTAGVLTINKAAGDYAVRISAATGNVKIIGFDVWNSTKPQVLFYPTASGSLTPDTQFALWDSNIRRVIMDEWSVDLITWNFADGTSSQSATAWNVLDDALSYSRRVPTVVMFDNIQDEISDQLRSYADSRDWYYFSMFDAWGKDATLEQLECEGLASTFDLPHKSGELYSLAATQVLRDIVPWTLTTSFVGPITKTKDWTDGGDWSIPVRDGIRWQDRAGTDLLRIGVTGEENYLSGLSENLAPSIVSVPHGVDLADSYIVCDPVDTAIGTGDFSIAFWARRDSGVTIFATTSNSSIGRFELQFRTDLSGFTLHGFDGFYGYGGLDAFSDGFWHFVVITADRDGDGQLYLDGDLIGTVDISSGSALDVSSTNWSWGATNNGYRNFDGDFANYGYVFSEVLTPAQIRQLWKSPADGKQFDSVLSAVNFTPGQGQVFSDSANANNWTVQTGTAVHLQPKFPYTGTATIDFASLATDASATDTITVTGAATDDTVILQPQQIDGVSLYGHVSSANTVTVTAINHSAGAIDPPSTSIRATVIKP